MRQLEGEVVTFPPAPPLRSCLADLVPGLPAAVQLRHPGAHGTLALPSGVGGHLLHRDAGAGESPRGEWSQGLSPTRAPTATHSGLPGAETSCTPPAPCDLPTELSRSQVYPTPLLSEGSYAFCVQMNRNLQVKTQGEMRWSVVRTGLGTSQSNGERGPVPETPVGPLGAGRARFWEPRVKSEGSAGCPVPLVWPPNHAALVGVLVHVESQGPRGTGQGGKGVSKVSFRWKRPLTSPRVCQTRRGLSRLQ